MDGLANFVAAPAASLPPGDQAAGFTVLLVGRERSAELERPLTWLCSTVACEVVADCRELVAVAERSPGRLVKAIVLLMPRPWYLSAHDVRVLHGAFPLARLIALCGSWSEGRRRKCDLPLSVVRWPWHQFVYRFQRELLSAKSPCWGPLLATETDRLLLAPAEASSACMYGYRQVVIRTLPRASFQGLAEAVRASHLGSPVVWWLPGRPLLADPPFVLVWDMLRSDDLHWREVEEYLACHPRVPFLILLGFPRLEDYQRVERWQNAALLGKPFGLADLRHCLARLGWQGEFAVQKQAG